MHSSLKPYAPPEIPRSLDVAISGLAQTIGFLCKFVKLNIHCRQFVKNLYE
ncbi:hypothetical protein F3P66_25495 (plasmid) [Agrobacterium fabrum]|uniref:Uncharacterized protein n=1 Tax=Agrobacterium fabrum (strain C58 / ATCC 33970) TaxID=176299 RepID=Q8U5X3_AGRFC|nr:hypothetical protein Atu8046 [Agrobacterium fabrum str. C58]QRM62719.1 hypothetical protein F3P66_25495 [Agrobacterium fabrum]TRB28183.1 hypothetical protein EXN51_16185 [Agrobacterium fabrum]